ncbi:hypothetical protein [Seonamhaeicola maritimus]|uniref:Uncharacterized protein n=1 Tax=Seonamhaeicola maritimus TaxID=2591822 RepID=A0A5C7GGF7_9FLAO|nr:hypothetical protein [Seonamhaeicola maritimus]TXG36553.1 hypothetical protein FUA22_08150 [Seonamhaeicola maritimus]
MLRLTEKVLFFFIIIFSFLNTQCEEDVIIDDLLCDFTTVIDETKYANLSSDNFTFVNAEIEGDCLSIEIGASGCDGSTWKFELIDSGAVAESFPEQRYLKLKFINNEDCLAYFERVISFDLTPIQVQGSNKIILHLDGLDESLEYSY